MLHHQYQLSVSHQVSELQGLALFILAIAELDAQGAALVGPAYQGGSSARRPGSCTGWSCTKASSHTNIVAVGSSTPKFPTLRHARTAPPNAAFAAWRRASRGAAGCRTSSCTQLFFLALRPPGHPGVPAAAAALGPSSSLRCGAWVASCLCVRQHIHHASFFLSRLPMRGAPFVPPCVRSIQRSGIPQLLVSPWAFPWFPGWSCSSTVYLRPCFSGLVSGLGSEAPSA